MQVSKKQQVIVLKHVTIWSVCHVFSTVHSRWPCGFLRILFYSWIYQKMLHSYFREWVKLSVNHPVLIERYMSDVRQFDVIMR